MSMKPTAPTQAATPQAASGGFSLRPSKQTVIILGSLIGVLLLSTAGYSVWQNGESETRKKVITEKTQQVNDSEMIARQLNAKEAEYEQVRGRISRLETSVSETDYVPTLLKQLERLATDNGLRVDGQSQTFEAAPEPPTDPEARKKFIVQPYDKEIIILKVRGRYWDIARFVYRLTEFPKILSVDKLDVKPQGDAAGESPILGVTINMTGYLFKPEADAQPVPEASPAPGGVAVPAIPTTAPTLPPRREI